MEKQTIIADGRYRTYIDPKSVHDMRYIGTLVEYLLTRRVCMVPYHGTYKIVHDTSTMPEYAGLFAYGSLDLLIDDINTHVKRVVDGFKKREPDYNPSFQLQLQVDWVRLNLQCTLEGITVQSYEFLTTTGFMEVNTTNAATVYETRVRAEINTLMRTAASYLTD